jgi:putative transposase
MMKISYNGYRFPTEIIQHAICLYIRFTLSFRDVRRWVNHFGPMIASDLRKRRPKPHTTWHLDEVYLKIDGRMVYLSRGGHLGIAKRHERGRWRNNRAENSHQPTRRRERKMQGFKSVGSAQKFLSTHAATYNTFNVQRHPTSARTHRAFRASAMQAWRVISAVKPDEPASNFQQRDDAVGAASPSFNL